MLSTYNLLTAWLLFTGYSIPSRIISVVPSYYDIYKTLLPLFYICVTV